MRSRPRGDAPSEKPIELLVLVAIEVVKRVNRVVGGTLLVVATQKMPVEESEKRG